jgi:hypothetical protein
MNEHHYHYSGPGPCLQPRIDCKLSTVLQACGIAGGFTLELIKRITANSNEYASNHLVGGKFAGSIWHPIETQEMFHALGIILKMSIDNRHLGGYHSYFTPPVDYSVHQLIRFK